MPSSASTQASGALADNRAAASGAPDAPIRIGVVGTAANVNPLTASTRPERDIAALVFAGLVRVGSDGTWQPDIARGWTVSDDGRTWTFELRDDATWHDGTPVTARDVVFTVDLLHDPKTAFAGAGSWRDVTATEVDERTVKFELGAPIAGFLDAARQPLLPAHLLDGVPAADLAADPFGRRPVGAGPYRLVRLDATGAVLEPAADQPAPAPSPTLEAGVPAATLPPAHTAPPDHPAPLEFRFHADPVALEAAWNAGDVDVASGLAPVVASRLGDGDGTRLVRYPTTTLTTVLLNQRVDHPELRDRATRRALLHAIDRESLVGAAWDGLAAVAAAPIPPGSWAFDPAASPPVAYDATAAAAGLEKAGWTRVGGAWRPPRSSAPYALEVVSPDLASNAAVFEAAASVVADLRGLGLTVDHVALPPAELVADRLRPGRFDAAVVDVNVGLDPDLYPLLASSQIRTTGLNLSGVVDRDLDRLLVAARAPGSMPAREKAYRALQERLSGWQYLLPLAFRDEPMLVRDTVSGVSERLVADVGDRFGDVLAWRLADDRGGG